MCGANGACTNRFPPALPSLPGLSEMELPPDPSEAIIESDSLPPPPAFSGAFTPTPPPQQSQEEFEEEARREAFEAALQGLLPLRPDEIRTLLEHFDRTRESVETPIYPDPKPEVAVETVPLDPGTSPRTVKMAYGHVTTINILDSTGSPWPIEDISWAGDFEVIESSSPEGAHILRISPQSEFARGNISIRLLTLKTPVILSLQTNRSTVHYRFDAIIPEYGPQVNTPLIESAGVATLNASGEPGSAAQISRLLEGVTPENAEPLDVIGVDSRTSAYKLSEQTYVRTPLTLLSPGWSRSVSSADGTSVYAIQDSPVLLLSDNGKMVRARLRKREELLDE